ncbi:MAG: DUF115 domain-containing protein [Ruminococcus sp.]|jgi:hypothetical protein|nr:DUF115 domain-containing protein [Ruminococcus sp.]
MPKNLIIFGAGEAAKQLISIIGTSNIAYIADNFPKSRELFGIEIIDFETMKKFYQSSDETVVIVASYDYYEEICQKLEANSIWRFRVWHREGVINNYKYGMNDFAFNMSLEKLGLQNAKNAAVCANESEIPAIREKLENANVNIRYFIQNDSPDALSQLQKFSDEIDVLLIGCSRSQCSIIDYAETEPVNFRTYFLNDYEYFQCNEEIKKYAGIHKGKRCFIIGNGPSLRMSDLEILQKNNEICCATNKIFYAFDDTNWRPHYYLAQDKFIMQQYPETISKIDSVKFIADRVPDFWDSDYSKGCLKYHIKTEGFLPQMPEFSTDFSRYSVEGTTVTYSALQLTAYMGFSEIFLLGVDFDYSGDMRKGENHFSKKYVSATDKFGGWSPDKHLLAYKKAELVSRLRGFKIYNATRGGKLEIFERVDFEQIVQNTEER